MPSRRATWQAGKQLLAKLLQQDPNNEAAWIWMSGTVEDIDQRRYCLEKALAINPDNATAQAGLLRLGFNRRTPHRPPRWPAWITAWDSLKASRQPRRPLHTPSFIWPEGGSHR